jgi:hypothetical protein
MSQVFSSDKADLGSAIPANAVGLRGAGKHAMAAAEAFMPGRDIQR